ncbi:uncharacterized protein LOC115421199 isoform X2 [Sphaeramia orbicularis]|uniref:uncharacterized protein LOC115421199 isoform X2 n=1 Tax=Sphaeramia orbicularis TaxID=375764 RepID=UPI00117E206C|nr:uncharacterized protein LOC115421199 isoform X2 [Sphaeramia orbicularis]
MVPESPRMTSFSLMMLCLFYMASNSQPQCLKDSPKILDVSQCVVEGMLLVCVCISQGNPLPQISWDLASVTDYSVANSSSIHTVNSILTMSASNYHNSTVKCISVNELGRAGKTIPLQTFPGLKKFEATIPWIIISGSSILNLIFLTLMICIYKRAESEKRKYYEETNTYASLNKADVQEEYSVISPRPT